MAEAPTADFWPTENGRPSAPLQSENSTTKFVGDHTGMMSGEPGQQVRQEPFVVASLVIQKVVEKGLPSPHRHDLPDR